MLFFSFNFSIIALFLHNKIYCNIQIKIWCKYPTGFKKLYDNIECQLESPTEIVKYLIDKIDKCEKISQDYKEFTICAKNIIGVGVIFKEFPFINIENPQAGLVPISIKDNFKVFDSKLDSKLFNYDNK